MNISPTRRHVLSAVLGAGVLRAAPAPPAANESLVSLSAGENRRKNIFEALMALDAQLAPQLKRKKSVVIKPNNVSTVRQLAASHADALRGILDYIERRFKGPVFIAESSAGDTMQGFENFKYGEVAKEFPRFPVKLVDLNAEALYEVVAVVDANLHATPVRLAKRLLDPEAFIISAGMLKTHNVVLATLGIKNMTLGAPLHQAPKETPRWNDKRKYHGGVRQTHLGIMQTAQRMAQAWSLDVIDGYEGMEGNGPSAGTPVASRLAIASTDFVAADRIGVDVMGIKPEHIGYLQFCEVAGVGRYDRAKIRVIGEDPARVKKEYKQHGDLERQLQWMGPLEEIPPKLG
jgi:uncharacterized protein (DUF362 family)